ncbi:Predicted baseplate [Pseudomonas marincola]|uniref:Predicted baseplate n=2 Tax=Pseudomonas marincola TaxID=437900 RepID=A0A653EAK3_9PSED|nr:Predicted baseplate [Pseudomonas marincola]
MPRARASVSISGMNSLTELARQLENLIRFGTVEAVQVNPPRVQVKTGNILTTWLPWLTPRAGADRAWNPPTIGEQVVLFSPSGILAQGVALTGLFSDLIPANGEREGLHRSTYRDGAVIEYDSIAKHLRATLPGTAEINATGSISITSGANITLTAAGNVAITGARVDLN